MRTIRTRNQCVELQQTGPVADLSHLPARCFDGVGQVMPKPEQPKVGLNLAVARLETELVQSAERLRAARLAEPLQEWIRQCKEASRRETAKVVAQRRLRITWRRRAAGRQPMPRRRRRAS
jgi:hypothetical protein